MLSWKRKTNFQSGKYSSSPELPCGYYNITIILIWFRKKSEENEPLSSEKRLQLIIFLNQDSMYPFKLTEKENLKRS